MIEKKQSGGSCIGTKRETKKDEKEKKIHRDFLWGGTPHIYKNFEGLDENDLD